MLFPQAFAHTPISLISGVVVTHPKDVLRVLSEGGGMRQLKPYLEKVNIRLSQEEIK